MSQSETRTDGACESPRDCKHGRLARSCEICELERDRELLHKGCTIEVAVRNPSVSEYMRYWEDRATKAESALTAAQERIAEVERELVEGMREGEQYRVRATVQEGCAQAAEARCAELREALRKLTLMARTSGGTAGPDAGLMAACEQSEAALAKEANHG